MIGDEVTDQPELDEASSKQTVLGQAGANDSETTKSAIAAQIEQQAALDSIFHKENDGVQFGSMPLPALDTLDSLSQSGKDSSGAFKPIKPSASGSFSRIAPPAAASSKEASKEVLKSKEEKGSSPVSNARPIIIFDRVSKLYPAQPNRPALNNISMTISSGEFVFLVGHSGSGKSTFIRLINHEFTTSSGRLVVAGEDLSTIRRWRVPYLRRNIGCVFQDFKLLPNKTAFQNVAFALQVIGKSKHIIRTQVPEVLRLVGLEDKTNKYPDQLSGGEQQRVSIARAIVNRPPMLICDEPTGNLDPQTSLGIMRLLDRINRTGTTILVATHDREMVDSMRKRVVALENGFLVRDEDKGVYGLDA